MAEVAELTRQQFNREVISLRNAFGTKTFWANPAAIKAARHALCVCYFNTKVPSDQQESLATTFESTLNEFTRRGELMGIDIETGEPFPS